MKIFVELFFKTLPFMYLIFLAVSQILLIKEMYRNEKERLSAVRIAVFTLVLAIIFLIRKIISMKIALIVYTGTDLCWMLMYLLSRGNQNAE